MTALEAHKVIGEGLQAIALRGQTILQTEDLLPSLGKSSIKSFEDYKNKVLIEPNAFTALRGFVPLVLSNFIRDILERRYVNPANWFNQGAGTQEDQNSVQQRQFSKYASAPALGYSASLILVNLIVHPFEVLRVQLSISMTKWKDENYIGMRKAAGNIVKSEGVSGLYRGFIPFTLFSLVHRNLIYDRAERGQERDPKIEAKRFLCDLTLYPLIVIGTRMMVQPRNPNANFKTLKGCCEGVYREFGWKGFYKGFWVTILFYQWDMLYILFDQAKRKF